MKTRAGGALSPFGRATWSRFAVIHPIRFNISRTDFFLPKNAYI
jgi:hypothetical protein